MAIKSNIEVTAEDKRMTMAEMRAFVAAASQAEVPDDTVIKVSTTMGGHIKRLWIA